MWGDFLEKQKILSFNYIYNTVQCKLFHFQYSLAEPDIQFVKVVFAMRLEFGLNIL